MGQLDLTSTQNQYDAMMLVLDGIRAKLGANKEVLTRILAMENGREKVKAFAATDAGKWLREVKKARDDLSNFFENAGWVD